ncbi:MAG: cytochrome P450 [Solirubrobacteraceae bacterium]|nr:cytochrome P450 [Solirubrobacteraceae bacterium]
MALPPTLALPSPVQTARWIARPTTLLERARNDCGDVYQLRFFPGGAFFLTNDPADVRRLFTAPPDTVPTATGNSPIGPLVGEHSLLTLNGREHLRQRKLLLPSFHGDRLRAYGEIIQEAAHAQIDTWQAGGDMRLQPQMSAITLEVILRAVFGVEDAARHNALRTAIEDLILFTASPKAIASAVVGTATGKLVGPMKRKTAAMDALLYDEIASHREHGGLEEREDILSLMMCARDEDGEGMTDIELRDELVTLLLAGHETTATSLAWAVERLVRTPSALARISDDPADDAYVDAVIHETLRDRPVVPIIGRVLQEPMMFGEYEVPAGSFAGASLYGTNHNAAVYEDPYTFRPERFLETKPDTYAWIPFGGGVRRCIGAAFAQLEMRIVLRAIFERAQLRAVQPEAERVRRRNITFVPEHGATVYVDALDRAPSRPLSLAA